MWLCHDSISGTLFVLTCLIAEKAGYIRLYCSRERAAKLKWLLHRELVLLLYQDFMSPLRASELL